MEFLTSLITVVPDGTSAHTEADTRAKEAIRAAELAGQGHLLRLWQAPLPSGQPRTLGLWRANSEEELHAILATLPLHVWMTVETTTLSPHPNDPGVKSARGTTQADPA
ncbi:muconolactone Delta-isomerase family protein [Streptomyces sp. WAC 04229]|uniref:muconolactone Delta-isomerase family protein n=1 Tax=Streptomyces sp. WAC 04229 TaxID=2203206 RepID=UPI003D716B2F